MRLYREKFFGGLKQTNEIPEELAFLENHNFLNNQCSMISIEGKIYLTNPKKNEKGALLYLSSNDYYRISSTVLFGSIKKNFLNSKKSIILLCLQANTLIRTRRIIRYGDHAGRTTQEVFYYLNENLEIFSIRGSIYSFIDEHINPKNILELLSRNPPDIISKDYTIIDYLCKRYKETLGIGYEYLRNFDNEQIQKQIHLVEEIKKATQHCIMDPDEFESEGKLSIAEHSENIEDGALTLHPKKKTSKHHAAITLEEQEASFFNLTNMMKVFSLIASATGIIVGHKFLALTGLLTLAFFSLTSPMATQRKKLIKEETPEEDKILEDTVARELENLS